MTSKHLLAVITLMVVAKSSFAQYSQDAIRYSTSQSGSTSRVKAIGDAGTAIGGDLSSIGGNPAGLGFFTKSELSFTPVFEGSKVNAAYLNQNNSATRSNANISNASWEFYNRLNTPAGQDKDKGWLSVNFGFAYNRTNNYGENIIAGGKNNSSSITDYYANLANANGTPEGSLQKWAFDHNLIDQYGTPPAYASNTFTGAAQLNSINRSGGESDFNISMGANYSNKLYLGIGLALTNLEYNSINSFNEIGTASVIEGSSTVNRNYNSTYLQSQYTKGSGVNVKFGVIYKPVNAIRFGATITSPTYYSIDDSYNEGLSTTLSSGAIYNSGPNNYPLTYSLVTPFRASGGVAVFLGQFGFITGDVEYVNYSGTKLKDADGYDSSFDNTDITTLYKATVNTHFGAEIRLPAGVFLRGGYGMQGSPLKQGGKSTNTVSGGVGYHVGSYYVDVTYANISGSNILTPYTAGTLTPTASLSQTNNNVFVTFGYRY